MIRVHRRHLLAAAPLAFGWMLHAPITLAQPSYPAKPVRIVVGVSPGTAGDTAARVVADSLARQLNQPFVVETRPGANGAIAASAVAGTAGDGYNLFFSASSPLTITPHLVKRIGFDPLTAFEPIVEVGAAPLGLFVSRRSDIRTFADFVRMAKAKEGKMDVGVLSLSMSQFAVTLLENMTGTKFHMIPYKGGPEMATAVISGEIEAGLVGLGGFSGQLGSDGQLRALGITTPQRISSFPDVPAIAEFAKGYDAGSWFGLFAPAGTPADIVGRLNAAVNTSLKDGAVRQALLNTGTIPTGGAPSVLREHLVRDHTRFGAEIQRLGVQPQ
jgi:tripartite-type tricarboxylate transporter receptor subunit TctC